MVACNTQVRQSLANEVDDADLGGERPGGKRGRGAASKTTIVAAVETTAERQPRRLPLSVVKGSARRR